jgi:hypothetical protein
MLVAEINIIAKMATIIWLLNSGTLGEGRVPKMFVSVTLYE